MASEPIIKDQLTQVLDEFVTQNSAARLLNISIGALRSRVHRGRIASIRAGSAILIPLSEIERVRLTYTPRAEIDAEIETNTKVGNHE